MIFSLNDRRIDNQWEKTTHVQTDNKGVHFNTVVTIHQDGAIRLYSQARNHTAFSKRTVSINVTVMNGERVIHGLSSPDVKLYGTAIASLVPKKKSSAILTGYGRFSLDDVAEQGSHEYDRAPHVREIDAEIAQTGKDIRKARILSDENSLNTLTQKLQSLKKSRQDEILALQIKSKLDSITVDVNHIV